MTNNAMTISVAEEASTSLASDNSACSDGRSQANKCSSGERIRAGDGNSKKEP